MDERSVTLALADEGLQVAYENDSWVVTYKLDAETTQLVFMFASADGDYFSIFSPVRYPEQFRHLDVKEYPPLEAYKPRTLRAMIRAMASVRLAKLDWQESEYGRFFMVSSDCSVADYTGAKLARRMEACALLCQKVEDILEKMPPLLR